MRFAVGEHIEDCYETFVASGAVLEFFEDGFAFYLDVSRRFKLPRE
jgi:hypothetical protein